MASSRAVAFAVPLVVGVGGCANSPSNDESRAFWLVNEDAAQDDWFCEPAEAGGWDCVQDPERVANPRPVRLPEPLFAQAVAPLPVAQSVAPPTAAPLPVAQSVPPPTVAPLPAPAPTVAPAATPSQPPDSETEPEDPSPIPLYQSLAYQPEQHTDFADLPGSYYTIQVIALSTREDLEQFTIDNHLPVMSGAIVEKDGERFFALLAGIYKDRETAERAARSLPENLSAHGPWIRSMESLQAAIVRAEQMPEAPVR